MIGDDPTIVLAASPREWAQRLHRHVADHGGALVRATVLHPADALAEPAAVFVVDDTTSFLSAHLVDALHRRGTRVLGVYDPVDADGRSELVARGADDVIERSADPAAFVAALRALAELGATDVAFDGLVADLGRTARAHVPEAERVGDRHGLITVVSGPPGGVGITEVALALAVAAGARGDDVVLVDGDETAPCLAQRLGVAPYPNLRAAVAAVLQRDGQLGDALAAPTGVPLRLLVGLAGAADWSEVRPGEVVEVLRALTAASHHVVVNAGHRLEDLPSAGGPARYGQTRALLSCAGQVVAVTVPTPVGVARLVEWAAQRRALAPAAPLHVVVNRCPASAYVRGEVERELERTLQPASLWFVPADERVPAAGWAGRAVPGGPFARAMAEVAAVVLPARARAARPGRRRRVPR